MSAGLDGFRLVVLTMPLDAAVVWAQIGDWGRQGISEQKKVAKMMAAVADCMPPAFIISTGDNFYSREYMTSGGQRSWSGGSPAWFG